jgi:hypothetical protein
MAAIVQIDESNGAGETQSANIANCNMGNVDAAALDPVAYPITPGANSYEKWQRFHVTDMSGSSEINNLKIWRTGALGGTAIHLGNVKTSAYAGAPTYAQPIKTNSTIAINAMPTSAPASANLGIGGALLGALTDVGYSDYLVHQIQTNAADTEGSTSTMNYQYDEIA